MADEEFKEGVGSFKDVKGMVFGDIYLDEHKDWVERVCKDLNIKAVEPLWNRPTEEIMEEFIDLSFVQSYET